MIFDLHGKSDLPYQSIKERICAHAGIRLESCNTSVIAALLRTAHNSSRSFRVQIPDQTQDAIIYVVMVVVFYAAIILILVGTNIRRHHQPVVKNPRRFREFFRKQTVLIFDNDKDKTKTMKTSHKKLHHGITPSALNSKIAAL